MEVVVDSEDQKLIERAWEDRSLLKIELGAIKLAIDKVMHGLTCGSLRVCSKSPGEDWCVNSWLKKSYFIIFCL